MRDAIAISMLLLALWTPIRAQTLDIAIPRTPELEDTLAWLALFHCAHLARLGQPTPQDLTVSLNPEGEPVCSGTPGEQTKHEAGVFYAHTLFGSQWVKKGRTEKAEMIRADPAAKDEIKAEEGKKGKPYEAMTKAERDEVKEAQKEKKDTKDADTR